MSLRAPRFHNPGRFRRALWVLAGSILFSRVAVAANPAPTARGRAAANQAYHELALKHYHLAIAEFQKALAADPSNFHWRVDLAYTNVTVGSLRDAIRQFETVYQEHPEQLKIALELGYLSQRLNRESAAEEYFEAAELSNDPAVSTPARSALKTLRASELQAQKQKAYNLLDQGRRQAAARLFEQIHEVDPNDATVTLQLGYLYQTRGEFAKARAMFQSERNSSNPEVANQATTALREVRRQSSWWFGTAYAAPFYQSRFANQINPMVFKIGLRPTRYLEPYFGMRFTRDIRSTTNGTLPEIYSDNSDVFSVGVQSPILGHGTNLYVEAGSAVSLLKQPIYGRAVPDYRAGITWYKPWGTSLVKAAKSGSKAISLTGNAYSDVSFYSRYNDNVIGYLQIREGINLPISSVLPMQLLAAVNVVRDSNADFYNNVVEVGPALRFAPFRRLPNLQFEADYVRGFYTVHDVANPYGARYGDFRVFLIWSTSF